MSDNFEVTHAKLMTWSLRVDFARFKVGSLYLFQWTRLGMFWSTEAWRWPGHPNTSTRWANRRTYFWHGHKYQVNKKVIFLSLSHVNILDLSCFFSAISRLWTRWWPCRTSTWNPRTRRTFSSDTVCCGPWSRWFVEYLVNIENDPVSLNDWNDSDDPVSSDSEPGREQVVPPVSSPHPGKISIYL